MAEEGNIPSQELRLGIFPSLATYVLPRLLRSQEWPDLGINLHVSVGEPQQTIAGLRIGGDLDVALVYQVGQSGLAWPHTINRQWIGDDNFRVVLPKSWGIRPAPRWPPHSSRTCHGSCTIRAPATPPSLSGSSPAAASTPRVAAYSDDFNASLQLASVGLARPWSPSWPSSTVQTTWWCWTFRRSGWPAIFLRC